VKMEDGISRKGCDYMFMRWFYWKEIFRQRILQAESTVVVLQMDRAR